MIVRIETGATATGTKFVDMAYAGRLMPTSVGFRSYWTAWRDPPGCMRDPNCAMGSSHPGEKHRDGRGRMWIFDEITDWNV